MERKTHRESWKGEESVKERFALPEPCVVPFLEGRYTPADAAEDLRAKGKSPEEAAKFQALAEEVYSQIDAKQLTPMIRTQYWRTAFQIPFDSTVRVSLDTNLCMIKENPDDAPTCAESGRWYRDPALPVPRTEITRFPHAVLEVKLSLPEGERGFCLFFFGGGGKECSWMKKKRAGGKLTFFSPLSSLEKKNGKKTFFQVPRPRTGSPTSSTRATSPRCTSSPSSSTARRR